MPTLDTRKQLVSDLWLDQPDAHERIDERLRHESITIEEAEQLHQFTAEGFTKLSLELDDTFVNRFDRETEMLWQTRPAELAVAKAKNRVSLRDSDGGPRMGHRIPDLHSHSEAALSLYLDPAIFRIVELIFDDPAVAFQSLYFEVGSEQGLHRDPMFVVTRPPSHLVASWIALEEITLDSGPLLYVRGSHRMPWFEFGEDKISINTRDGRFREWSGYHERVMEEMGLRPEPFTCARGDVFIWHGGLLHGGMRRENPDRTRKSFVVHYSTARNYGSRTASVRVKRVRDGKDSWYTASGTTSRMLERNDCRGLDNPLREADLVQGDIAEKSPADRPSDPSETGRSRLARALRSLRRRAHGR
jgi:phytanoyl-CoA hydroxylase